MVRLIFLALTILLAFMLWRWLTGRLASGQSRKPLSTDLVRCTSCGMHVPRDSAVHTSAGWRCTDHALDGEH